MDRNVHKKVRYGMRYIYRKKIMLLLLIAVSLISMRLLTGCGEGLSILTDDDSSVIDWSLWSYRRSVTITNGVTAQSDYQVNINLSNLNFTFSHAETNGNDLRFNYDGVSIPYWIESWNSGGETASIWVKVPSIPAGGKVIYMYYGKAGETAASDFDNTFTKNSGFSGLVAQWHMDEGSGSSINDSSSNTNDGTMTGASWVGADGGRWYTSTTAGFSTGDSLNFDGTDDYVTIADSASLDVTNITIALWVNVDRVDITQHFVSKWVISTNDRSYALYMNADTVQFETSFNGSASDILSSTVVLSSGTWYHLAATFNGTVKRIYINGTERGNKSVTGNLYISIASLTIGTINTSLGNHVDGLMDEVSIYNTALSADEVKALSQRRKDSADVGDLPTVGSEESVP